MRAKMNRYGMVLFLTLLDRFKNHIFYERKLMKKLALFLTDVKKLLLEYFLSYAKAMCSAISKEKTTKIFLQTLFGMREFS
jgi:hypothetical protein